MRQRRRNEGAKFHGATLDLPLNLKPDGILRFLLYPRETWRDWRIEADELMRLARVLEIGCGGGGLLRLLCERGARAVGVDTLSAALELARERLETERKTRREGDKEKNLPLSPCLELVGTIGYHFTATRSTRSSVSMLSSICQTWTLRCASGSVCLKRADASR